MTVNIKYCGGCNPRYDRESLVEKLKKDFSEVSFVSEHSDNADAVVLVCGCSSACADVTDSYGRFGRFVIWGSSAYDGLCDFLRNIEDRIEQSS